jgi:hypothetical protein
MRAEHEALVEHVEQIDACEESLGLLEKIFGAIERLNPSDLERDQISVRMARLANGWEEAAAKEHDDVLQRLEAQAKMERAQAESDRVQAEIDRNEKAIEQNTRVIERIAA